MTMTRPHLGWEDVLYDGVFAALLTLPVTGTLLHQPATHISINLLLSIYLHVTSYIYSYLSHVFTICVHLSGWL